MRKNTATTVARKSSAPLAKQASPAAQDPSAPASDGPPFTPEELSEYLWTRWRIKRSPRRLGQLRSIGGGGSPPYVRDGLAVRYPRKLADQWAAETLGQPVRSTAEEAVRYPNNFGAKNARAMGLRPDLKSSAAAG
jgi:hypothetical protein